LTTWIQKLEFLKPVAIFCSSVLTFWVVIYIFYVLPISPFGYVKTTHYLALFFCQFQFVSWLKVAYGQSRPVLQCDSVKAWECACDYGMPSGHSSIGIMNGYILGDLILTHLKLKYTKDGKSTAKEVEEKFGWIKIVSWVFGVSVGLSRIVLGVHSWS
jgi:membrane-associated phospholipid phosphatase